MKLIKVKPVTKSYIREFEKLTTSMVDLIGRLFKNQVLLQLNNSTINKFQDKQIGNYAVIFNKLAKQFSNKILQRFDNDRINDIVSLVLDKTNTDNKKEIISKLSNSLGISATNLAYREGLKPTTNALILETIEWVKRLRDNTLNDFTTNSLRLMSLGNNLSTIIKNFNELVDDKKSNAKFLARNQISNFNSMLTKVRAQNVNITEAIWATAEDERVRPSHKDRDQKQFDLKKGLYSSKDGKFLLPGIDYNCRCSYILILPED